MKATQSHVDAYPQIISSIINACNFQSYLELGIGYGVCLQHMVNACPGLDITAVDIKPLPGYNRGIGHDRVRWSIGITTDQFFLDNEQMFDAVFIDADHSAKQAIADFDNALKFLNTDGVIFLHDTYPPDESFIAPNRCYDSFRAYLKLCADPASFEVVNLPTFCGLTIVRPVNASQRILTLPKEIQTDANL